MLLFKTIVAIFTLFVIFFLKTILDTKDSTLDQKKISDDVKKLANLIIYILVGVVAMATLYVFYYLFFKL